MLSLKIFLYNVEHNSRKFMNSKFEVTLHKLLYLVMLRDSYVADMASSLTGEAVLNFFKHNEIFVLIE